MKPARTQFVSHAVLAAIVAAATGCSMMEGAGRWTRETGESWEQYSKTNDGFMASVAGFGGKVNKAVGGSVESMAKSEEGSAAEAKPAAPATATSQRAPSPAATPVVATAASTNVVTSVAPVAAVNAPPPAPTQASINARAQVRLQELGYNIGKPDGVIGARTKAAIQGFQHKQGLQVTGSLDPATLAALGLGSSTASRSGRGA